MKSFIDVKIKLIKLFTIVILLPSFGGVGGGLYAQDSELFNHTWYLEKIVIDDEEFLLSELIGTPYFNSIINEMNFEIYQGEYFLNIFFCHQWHGNFEIDNTTLSFLFFEPSPIDACEITPGEGGDHILDYQELYLSIYFFYDVNSNIIPKNFFTYTIATVSDYFQLTIENGEGDWAVYNSVLLSTSSFNESSFYIYPIPVKETLYINYGSKQHVTTTIYDISGKELQKHFFEDSNETIDVKALNPGLYFIVFENETGERVSKKFVKN